MHPDPALYIISAAVLGAAIGFFGCALAVSRAIRHARDEAFDAGYSTCNRDHDNARGI